jgi:hypothetical protein
VKTSIAVLVLLMSAGIVYTQAPIAKLEPRSPELSSLPVAQTPPAASQPNERSINHLLFEIQAIRTQKEELARKEQALTAELRKLVEQQNEQLFKMGLGAPVQPSAVNRGIGGGTLPASANAYPAKKSAR